MKIRTIGVLSLVGVATSITPVWAGPVGVQRSLSHDQQTAALTQLEAKQEQVSRKALAPNAKGPLLVRYMDKHTQLQDLESRIQSGQAVSPDEIDQALQPSND
jgi:hypothetical protein